jgi:hypothetical protein
LTDDEAKQMFFYVICNLKSGFRTNTHPEKVKTLMNHGIVFKFDEKLYLKACSIVSNYNTFRRKADNRSFRKEIQAKNVLKRKERKTHMDNFVNKLVEDKLEKKK